MIIELQQSVMRANNTKASELRAMLDAKQVKMINIIGSPGAGKTTLLERTLERLSARTAVAVIEGDVETARDAERLQRFGVQLVSINTGGMCHLEAPAIAGALEQLNLSEIGVVVIENVGNLICPVEFDLGDHLKVAISSVPEGDDKPGKYPALFRAAEVAVLNKIDLAPYTDFSLEAFEADLRSINPGLPLFPLSARTSEGLEAWLDWLEQRVLTAPLDTDRSSSS